MKNLFTDKRIYFAGFGAIGGYFSGILYAFFINSHTIPSVITWVGSGAFDVMMIGALLAYAQHRYTGKTFDWYAIGRISATGGVIGAIAGMLVFYICFPIAHYLGGDVDLGRFIGWTLMGLLIGLIISKAIPNLKASTGVIAGGIGGLVGCGLMYLFDGLFAGKSPLAGTFTAAAGRIISWTILGLASGFILSKYISKLKRNTVLMTGGISGLTGCGLMYLLDGIFAGTAFATVVRFIGWMLWGMVISFVLSQYIPKFKMTIAVMIGAIVGLISCRLMGLIGGLFIGTAFTGAMIGLAIAIAEVVFRKAWLEVTIKPGGGGVILEKSRTITVSLGEKPIMFGCANDADVKLSELPHIGAHFATVSLIENRVILDNLITEKKHNLSWNDTFEISNAQVVLRSATVTSKCM